MKKLANYLWVEKVGDLYVFSMTPELQDDIGTVGYVEFVSPDEVKVDDEIVSIEASKTVIDVQTPLSGTIIERNTKAEEEPTILNSEKPEENWLFKLDDVDKEAFLALPEAYMETLKSNKARLEYLINDMHRERNDNDVLVMPSSFEDLWELYRGLANVRPALPVSDEYLAVQDAMLSDLNRQHVTDLKDLKPIKGDNIFVWQGDITTLKIDAIVNAANSRFLGCMQANHDCIDNIIHTKAGVQVRLDCAEIIRQQGRNEGVGKAKITRGYNLPAKYIIHTVGPQIRRLPVSKMNQDLLAKCYLSCLKLADQHSLNHVAFCCISTGVFAFPQDEAAEIAVRTVESYLKETNSTLKVVFNVFTDKDLQLYKEAFNRDAE